MRDATQEAALHLGELIAAVELDHDELRAHTTCRSDRVGERRTAVTACAAVTATCRPVLELRIRLGCSDRGPKIGDLPLTQDGFESFELVPHVAGASWCGAERARTSRRAEADGTHLVLPCFGNRKLDRNLVIRTGELIVDEVSVDGRQ